MAELVAVRLKGQSDDVAPGLMPKAYFEKFGKAKGYEFVKDDAAQAAAAVASGADPDADARPKGR